MKKKTIVKIVLDILMLVVIALMYRKQALGLQFHEIGGLALIGVFFVHKGLNFMWIRRVTVKLKTADARTRAMWIVDAMMLISFLLVGISGILISKVAFPGLAVSGGPWKAIHYGCAALSLLLVGVHLGLHFNYLKGIFSRWVRLPRAIAVALAAIIFAYGVYGIATTSFTRWLSMPFTASAEGGEGAHGDRGGQFPGVTEAQDPSSSDMSAEVPTESAAETPDAETPARTSGSGADASQASGSSETNAAETLTGFGQGTRQGMGGGHGEQTGSALNALTTFLQFFAIAFVFAAPTALLPILFKSKKRRAAA
jgi:hypothetical protein